MELQIAGTNIELTPVVQRYIERKLGKLNKHLPDIIDSKVEISEEDTRSPKEHYLVRVTDPDTDEPSYVVFKLGAEVARLRYPD